MNREILLNVCFWGVKLTCIILAVLAYMQIIAPLWLIFLGVIFPIIVIIDFAFFYFGDDDFGAT